MLVLVVAGVLGLAAPALAQSFDYSPPAPFTNDVITFTASGAAGPVTWDFDGDAVCEPGASGAVITHTFATAGRYPVKMCVADGSSSTATKSITVQNRPPTAAFTLVPGEPLARETVVLTSTSVDPDGPVVAQEWDLNGDGVYGDATGEAAFYSWRWPGTYPIGLRVTDRDGAAAIAQASVVVAPRPPGQLSPQPVVRVVGDPTQFGARLTLLTVSAPEGAHVGVRCKGRNCPYKRKRFIAKGGRVSLRAMRRTFRAGAVIEIRVTKPETIGRLTRLRIRAGDRPARLDRCLLPGKPEKPVSCESA